MAVKTLADRKKLTVAKGKLITAQERLQASRNAVAKARTEVKLIRGVK